VISAYLGQAIWKAAAKPLFHRLSLQPNRWKPLNDGGCELTEENWQWARNEVKGWLRLKGPKARFSAELIDQLTWAGMRCEELYGKQKIFIDMHSIFDAIEDVESGTSRCGTKRHARFRPEGAIIDGLWHKHWFQTSFMVQNLCLQGDKDLDYFIYKRLEEMTVHKLKDGIPADIWQKALPYLMVTEAFERRSFRKNDGYGALTGEWIIFSKDKNDIRTYLCLATHDEKSNFEKEFANKIINSKIYIEI
jgi:hypothetical protein